MRQTIWCNGGRFLWRTSHDAGMTHARTAVRLQKEGDCRIEADNPHSQLYSRESQLHTHSFTLGFQEARPRRSPSTFIRRATLLRGRLVYRTRGSASLRTGDLPSCALAKPI